MIRRDEFASNERECRARVRPPTHAGFDLILETDDLSDPWFERAQNAVLEFDSLDYLGRVHIDQLFGDYYRIELGGGPCFVTAITLTKTDTIVSFGFHEIADTIHVVFRDAEIVDVNTTG